MEYRMRQENGKSAGYKRNESMQSWTAMATQHGCVVFYDEDSNFANHNIATAVKYGNKQLIIYDYKNNQYIRLTVDY